MSIRRILDANGNRAREALRVMEESARFLLDDATLTEELKRMRHALDRLVQRFGPCELHRDTPADVGTAISTPHETSRESTADVVAAAGKRLGEALRVIEEYGKTIDIGAAGEVESLRYAAYEVERRLSLAMGARIETQWDVCVILTEPREPVREWTTLADAVLAATPACVQLRDVAGSDAERLRRARYLVAASRPETAIIVNDRVDIALAARADGVHLGQHDLPAVEARKIAGRELVIGVSTSSLAEARRALECGADYCGVGPMFPSSTKAKDTIAGPAYLREYLAWGRLPHLAIGGITVKNVGELVRCGARGVAVSAAVCEADDPAGAVRAFQRALAGAAASS